MAFVTCTPGARLAPFVTSIWYFEGEFSHAFERILPTGAMQLLVNLDADELRTYDANDLFSAPRRTRGAAFAGACSEPFAIDTGEQRAIAGVTFAPGGGAPFLPMPACALAESHVDAGDVWGREGELLRERLLEAGPPARKLALLESVLTTRMRDISAGGAISRAISDVERGARVGDVVARFGGTPRRFIERFAATVGLTPKRFARVRRFQRVTSALAAGAGFGAGLAHACGYFDQAHMIRDFRLFSGLTPTTYRPRAVTDGNHVVLAERENSSKAAAPA